MKSPLPTVLGAFVMGCLFPWGAVANDEATRLLENAMQLEGELPLVAAEARRHEVLSQIDETLVRGDAVLEQWAGPLPAGFDEAGQALVAATHDAVAAIEKAKAQAVAAVLAELEIGPPEPPAPLEPPPVAEVTEERPGLDQAKPSEIRIDPWGNADQECGYFPADFGPITLVTGEACAETEVGNLNRLIPARFRLAEALGIGRHRVVCEPRYIDPIYEQRPSDVGETVVHARLQCLLTIAFVPVAALPVPEPAEPSARDGTKSGRMAVQVMVTSRHRMPALRDNRILPPSYEKYYRIGEQAMAENFTNDLKTSLWQRESLPAAAAERGWVVRPATTDSSAASAEAELVQAIEVRLHALKSPVAQRVREATSQSPALDRLLERRRHFLELAAAHTLAARPQPASSEPASSKPALPALKIAARRLEALDVDRLIEANRLHDNSLARLGPATAAATRSVRRAAQVDAVDPDQRAVVERWAATLDNLESWKLR